MTLGLEHLGWPRQGVSGHHVSPALSLPHRPQPHGFPRLSTYKVSSSAKVHSSGFQVTFFFSFLFVWLCAWCNTCLLTLNSSDPVSPALVLQGSTVVQDFVAFCLFVWDKLTRNDGVNVLLTWESTYRCEKETASLIMQPGPMLSTRIMTRWKQRTEHPLSRRKMTAAATSRDRPLSCLPKSP